jgi:CRISPR/Cas system-associated exonuclease Cas4 (RecB family)
VTQSAAWHAERLTGIGASDMSDLFSLPSPYSTIPQAGGCQRRLWYEKRQTPRDFERVTKPSMQRGTDCEEIVARKLAEQTGWRLTKKREMLRNRTYPFLIAHVDREIGGAMKYEKPNNAPNSEYPELPRGRGAAELKTMNGNVAKKVAKAGLNDSYLTQMQAILLAGDGRYSWGAFAIHDMDAWDLLPPIIIEPDYTVQAKIRDAAGVLWEQTQDPLSVGPQPLPSFDPRCSECSWRTKCQNLS